MSKTRRQAGSDGAAESRQGAVHPKGDGRTRSAAEARRKPATLAGVPDSPRSESDREIRHALHDRPERWLVPRHLATVDSTNDEALRHVRSKGPLGGAWLLTTADEQQRGRGRLGHGWFSVAGRSLTMSLAAELPLPADRWPRASLVVGAAVADAVRQVCGVDVGLKWPNDLLVCWQQGWRKVGGVLCERHDFGRDPALWIAGIGLNLAVPRSGFPEPLRAHAASLDWLAEAPDPTALAVAIAVAVRAAVGNWVRADGHLDAAQITERMLFVGDPVALDFGPDTTEQVVLRGLAPDGSLLVTATNGPDSRAQRAVQPLAITAASGATPWAAPPRLPRPR